MRKRPLRKLFTKFEGEVDIRKTGFFGELRQEMREFDIIERIGGCFGGEKEADEKVKEELEDIADLYAGKALEDLLGLEGEILLGKRDLSLVEKDMEHFVKDLNFSLGKATEKKISELERENLDLRKKLLGLHLQREVIFFIFVAFLSFDSKFYFVQNILNNFYFKESKKFNWM